MSDNRAPVGQTIDKWYKCSICICKYFFFNLMYCWFGMRKIKIHSSKWSSYTRQVGSSKHWAAVIFFFTCMSVSTKAKYSSYILHILLTIKLKVNPRRLNTQALDVNILWVHAWLWALRTICTTELLNLADFGKWERVNQNN